MSTAKTPYLERTLDETLPELKAYLTTGAKVLDIGCGPGTITCGVAEVVKPGEVVGIDIDPESIEKAEELAAKGGLRNISFRLMDTHTLDFPEQTFDIVFSHTALHEFIDPVGALKEQKRVTKTNGWVIAAGVRDWGLVPRYPPTPTWDRLYESWVQYYDFRCHLPDSEMRRTLPNGHPQAARRCPEWFANAGLSDLSIALKTYRLLYRGADDMKPNPIDLLPYAGDDEFGWYASFDETYDAMVADGFIDPQMLNQANEEAKAWYQDPRAFHFWTMVFAAGRV